MPDCHSTAAPAAPHSNCGHATLEAKRLLIAYTRLPDNLQSQVLHDIELLSFQFKPHDSTPGGDHA